jgi:hypothetical protein
MSKEAMKLALEALKDNQHLVADNERHAYVMEYNAIIEKREEARAKQEQGEPVAWMQSDEVHISLRKDHYHTIPLYTTPQQRKPLTVREIAEFVGTHEYGAEQLKWFRLGEAAHGIKE